MAKLIRFDWAMKNLLRDKANFDILEGFLGALLNDDSLTVLQLLESEANQEDENNKFNRVDILVEDGQKRKIIIEIQNTRENDYLERLLFGTSKVIVSNHQLGTPFKNISKVISVSILYFNLGRGDDYIYRAQTIFEGVHTHKPLIVKEKVETTEHFETRYTFQEKNIFPDYYLIRVEKFEDVIQSNIDEWIYMIKNNEVKSSFKSRGIDKAQQKLVELNMSETERRRYEKYLSNFAADQDVIETTRRDSEMKGVEKGIEIGMEKGIGIGMEKGEEKGKNEVAKNMKLEGFSTSIISKLTGLSKAEIEAL
jgi:predicted transposase/invertase (TIGR01784 family)